MPAARAHGVIDNGPVEPQRALVIAFTNRDVFQSNLKSRFYAVDSQRRQ